MFKVCYNVNFRLGIDHSIVRPKKLEIRNHALFSTNLLSRYCAVINLTQGDIFVYYFRKLIRKVFRIDVSCGNLVAGLFLRNRALGKWFSIARRERDDGKRGSVIGDIKTE